MVFVAATEVSIQWLSFLRNIAFVALNCAVLSASVSFSFKGGKSALSWFVLAILVAAALFAVSLSRLKHQMLHVAPVSQSGSSIGATLESTVQECGDAVMKACLVAAGVYIVLQGWRLLVLFSRTRVANGPLTIVRFFVGALLCMGILGVGLSAHRAPVTDAPKSGLGAGTFKDDEPYLKR